jgi:predicted enzyme related to lactoylglutathione lyase
MNNVINWFEIPVVDMDRAVAFYEPVMQVTLRRENMDCANGRFPASGSPGGALAKFDGVKPADQGCIIYLHTDNLAATLDRVNSAGGSCVFGRLSCGRYWHHRAVYGQRR